MTRAELETLLIALFGSLGGAAVALDTSRFTIRAWGRDNPVPPAVASLLRMLAAERGVTP
ncbi:hypothetical protein R5W24_000493 [Gemmata sp. JC717]|uniref:hypothetical protein n=1 Tax=Gemmata algarum TaxID=2975278 RepID=UPI0021BB8B44|nr:hypothetical protein [Gemmata algarum]MDY3551417.1 hypothetical protein [Gemmata algarum]